MNKTGQASYNLHAHFYGRDTPCNSSLINYSSYTVYMYMTVTMPLQ